MRTIMSNDRVIADINVGKNVDDANITNGGDNNAGAVDRTFPLWLVIPLAILSFGLCIGLPLSISVMFLDWQETFQINRAETAAIASASTGILFGAAVLCGYAANRFGARFITMAGSLIASLGYFLGVLSINKELLMFSNVLGAFGGCCVQMAVIPAIAEIIPGRFQGLAISLSTACSGIIIALIPLLYELLVEFVSWRFMYTVYASLSLQICVMGMIFTSVKSTPCTSFSQSMRSLTIRSVDDVATNTLCRDMSSNETANEEYNISLPPDVLMCNSTSQVEEPLLNLEFNNIQSSKFEKIGSEYTCSTKNETPTLTFKENLSYHVTKLKSSKWKFMFDRLYIVFIAHAVFGLSYLFVFPFFFMDFAKTKGFDKSTGVLFFTTNYACSLAGRVLVGLLNTSERFHSITLYTLFSAQCAIVIIIMVFTESFVSNLVVVVCYGIGYGACIAMQMKCIVDIKVIDSESYPLALGICCTLEGIVDFLHPIFIGYTVDKTGSYTLILTIMGCQSLVFSAWLWVEFWRGSREEQIKPTKK